MPPQQTAAPSSAAGASLNEREPRFAGTHAPRPAGVAEATRIRAAAPRRGLPLIAAAVVLAAAGCTTTDGTHTAGEADATCREFGGPAGTANYRACLARLDAQSRDEMLTDRSSDADD